MASFKAILRLTRIKGKKVKQMAKIVAPAVAGGAVVGAFGAPPGLRKSGASEGSIVGVLVGGAILASPKVGRIIFRRIRGRIVPFRVKT